MAPHPLIVQTRAIRKARGWSQLDLAERVGVSRSYISRLESGWVQPSLRLLLWIAEALGVELTIKAKE